VREAERNAPLGKVFEQGVFRWRCTHPLQLSTGAEVSSFNSQPQAYSLLLFRVRLRLTVKRFL
jgi:hypothetical protein